MLKAISRMPNFLSTTELAREARRVDGAKAFFSLFPSAWKSVEREVWKLEGRQVYKEPGNPSWELLSKGDLEGAMQLIPATRQADVPLYDSLAERSVRFLRLRPVVFPLSNYLQWELGSYAFNEEHGESIYFLEQPTDIFDNFVCHDFMVFDTQRAFIHDYDADGLIQGGWELTTTEGVSALRELYKALLDQAEPYRAFLERHSF
jgi:hypothetical protein